MFRVWIDNVYQTKGPLVNYVKGLLKECGLNYTNVEVSRFCNFNDTDLGDNFEIIDEGSRDTILVCIDGVVHTDEQFIDQWIDENCS